MTPRIPRRPTRWTLILRARRLRRLQAELSEAAEQAQLTPAEINIIEHAGKGLYQVEFILTTSARRVRIRRGLGLSTNDLPPSAAWDQQS